MIRGDGDHTFHVLSSNYTTLRLTVYRRSDLNTKRYFVTQGKVRLVEFKDS